MTLGIIIISLLIFCALLPLLIVLAETLANIGNIIRANDDNLHEIIFYEAAEPRLILSNRDQEKIKIKLFKPGLHHYTRISVETPDGKFDEVADGAHIQISKQDWVECRQLSAGVDIGIFMVTWSFSLTKISK